MSNVVGINGTVPAGQVNTDLIEMLEEYLERAKSGEIAGASIAYVRHDYTLGHQWDTAGMNFEMMASINVLNHQFCRNLIDGVG